MLLSVLTGSVWGIVGGSGDDAAGVPLNGQLVRRVGGAARAAARRTTATLRGTRTCPGTVCRRRQRQRRGGSVTTLNRASSTCLTAVNVTEDVLTESKLVTMHATSLTALGSTPPARESRRRRHAQQLLGHAKPRSKDDVSRTMNLASSNPLATSSCTRVPGR